MKEPSQIPVHVNYALQAAFTLHEALQHFDADQTLDALAIILKGIAGNMPPQKWAELQAPIDPCDHKDCTCHVDLTFLQRTLKIMRDKHERAKAKLTPAG